jgi:predicted N-formylglutamate amidohydrolase
MELVVSVEHASNRWPAEVPDPGLPAEVYASHTAWDPAALPVARAVADALGAPLLEGRYTRLFVDLNRSPTSPECVPRRAFGVDVPGNVALDADAIAARIAEHHTPYRSAVEAAVRERLARGVLHLSVHSFTDVYEGRVRDVDLGLLVDPTRPLEARFSALARATWAATRFDVRENEPYDGRTDALTTALRGRLPEALYAGVELEISHRHLGALDEIAAMTIDLVRVYLGR